MDFVTIGLIVSSSTVLILIALFAFEARRGARIFLRLRRYADYLVLRATCGVRHVVKYFVIHVVRQTGHYSFHLLLAGALSLMRRGERAVRDIMRTNKTLARTAERERTSKTKLEEIALHKMETTLSDKERTLRKERALNG